MAVMRLLVGGEEHVFEGEVTQRVSPREKPVMTRGRVAGFTRHPGRLYVGFEMEAGRALLHLDQRKGDVELNGESFKDATLAVQADLVACQLVINHG